MKATIPPRILGSLLGLLTAATAAPGAADADLAAKAQAVLRAHCSGCHGPAAKPRGGFGYVLERDQLVARGKVVPGRPAESELYQRIVQGEMPPRRAKSRPSSDEVALLRQWIAAGAPAVHSARPPLVSERDELRLLLADLQTTNPRQRRFLRYLTFAHLASAGRGPDELRVGRLALAKLLNSLSWHPRLTAPRAIDPAATVYRIDLRDYQWNSRLWDRMVTLYPYHIPDGSAEARACALATGTEVPLVRADWFLATASRPPLYYDLLQLPTNDRELERQLRVDVLTNIEEETALRAGFNDSGVSKNNRLIERHDAAFGAYWRSYDFSDNVDRQNLFEHPLGPVPAENAFVPAGGEIIFNLPNGLQAYLLVDGTGRRIERAPVEIVSDPNRPDRFVEAGLSCMACHARGMILKDDQVRAHVEKNQGGFAPEDVETVRALYPPRERLRTLMRSDANRFLRALARIGVPRDDADPVAAATLAYEAPLDLARAAAEAGLPADEFAKRLRESVLLARTLGPLAVPGGTVPRQVFLTAYPDLVREFRLAEDPAPAAAPVLAAPGKEVPPFTGHTGFLAAVAFSPDGRRALSAGEDKTVRLWDVARGRELRCLEGHTDEVLAVAFAPDGGRAASGGRDRTVRVWDLLSGRELACLQGHTDRVSSLAFAPDGRRVLSASWDQTLRLWDVDSGRELARLAGHAGWISSVAFSPDGRLAVSGAYDRTVRLWDLAGGREIRRFDGHTREVYAVAFAPDGRRVLSGGNDRSVYLWDAARGHEIRHWDGLAHAVIQVAFSPDGRRVLSGSSQYEGSDPTVRVWDAEDGKLRAVGAPGAGISCLAFSPDGRRALASTSEKTLRLWNLAP